MNRKTLGLRSLISICALSAFLGGAAQAWELDYGTNFQSETTATDPSPAETDESSCSPIGHVVYRLAGAEKETGEPTVGRLEALTQAKRIKNSLTVVTASGERIEYPFASAYWASIALEQLCTEQAAYLDMSDCKFEREKVLFDDRACDSSVARREAYQAASKDLAAVGDRLDGDTQSLRLESLRYSCPRSWFFFPRYKDGGKDRILRRLPVDAPDFRESYRIFSRGEARKRAVSKALETGKETLGLTRMSVISCGPPVWQDNTIY